MLGRGLIGMTCCRSLCAREMCASVGENGHSKISYDFDMKVNFFCKRVLLCAFLSVQRCVDRLVGVRNGAVATFGFSHFSAVF